MKYRDRTLEPRLPWLMVLALGLSLAGCDEGNDPMTQEDYNQVASALGTAWAAESESISVAADAAMYPRSVDAHFEWDSAHLTVSHEVEVECRDPRGDRVACDSSEAAAIFAESETLGTIDTERLMVDLESTTELSAEADENTVVIDGSRDVSLEVEAVTLAGVERALEVSGGVELSDLTYTTASERFTEGRATLMLRVRVNTDRGSASREREATMYGEILFDDETTTLILDGHVYDVHEVSGAATYIGPTS